MPRPVSFDRDAVVRAARTLFWHDGYEASVPDLERVTGLARSSIYNTFGSKRALFDEAVQSYLDEVIRPRLRPLESETVAPGAIVDYLTGLRAAFQHPDSMTASSGCLLINSAGTAIARDPHVARVIADAHHASVDVLRGLGHVKSGWTVANQVYQAVPGYEKERYEWG